MKIWNGYGSEHSANLVMIGIFKDEANAKSVKTMIDSLTAAVAKEGDQTDEPDRFSDEMLALLDKLHFHSISPAELQQFAYDVSAGVENNRVVLRTDELEISGFLKLLIDRGAKVEIYSAHDDSADNK